MRVNRKNRIRLIKGRQWYLSTRNEGPKLCRICILDCVDAFMYAFEHKKRSNQKNFIYPEFLMVKNVPFSEKFPKLIVRRIFTTKLNPPEPMEAKIIDPNSVGVILRLVYKGKITPCDTGRPSLGQYNWLGVIPIFDF